MSFDDDFGGDDDDNGKKKEKRGGRGRERDNPEFGGGDSGAGDGGFRGCGDGFSRYGGSCVSRQLIPVCALLSPLPPLFSISWSTSILVF